MRPSTSYCGTAIFDRDGSPAFGEDDLVAIINERQDPEVFRAWLSNQPVDRTFDTNNRVTCPIAQYLSDGTGEVLEFNPQATSKTGVRPWQIAFGQAVDREPGPTVTVSRCLEILTEIGQ